jgi:hypothetical protein
VRGGSLPVAGLQVDDGILNLQLVTGNCFGWLLYEPENALAICLMRVYIYLLSL